ncbi:MAG: hypothetical protein ACYTDU_05500 [Planctomycetota bacterium]
MTWAALLLAASLDLIVAGEPRVHLETDATPAARFAADLLKRHVVLMAGTALPERGGGAVLRFERNDAAGYAIGIGESGAVVRGGDLVRAAFDILESWGCRFDGGEPVLPRRKDLRLEAREWRPERVLYVEEFDPSIPAQGIAVRGLAKYRAEELQRARELGYRVRVASTSFDDFLPPELFGDHPEWFARRQGKREARGNFALQDGGARAAYVDRLGEWLSAHPEVDCVGIWPEVTTVWDEEALARGAPESYALLWREAAARFPARRFEILATGLTLKPPAGKVPGNIDVRLRPGKDASGLQGVAGQALEEVVRAWEVRGARVLLEIDAAPEAWCGMPWPCYAAVQADARRFAAAVLRGGGHVHARIWRDPDAPLPAAAADLLRRARGVRSWGHPTDAAELFFDERFGIAFRIGAVERLYRVAANEERDVEERRSAAADAYLGYRAILAQLPRPESETYRRYRARDYRRLLEGLLPGGSVEHQVGPARVREGLDSVEIETDRLRFGIDRRTATVVSLYRKQGKEWSADLAGGAGKYFAVVALATKTDRTEGEVRISSPETGRVRIDLQGRLSRGGPRWSSTLSLSNASGLVHQVGSVDTPGGIVAGCKWNGPSSVYDRWVCPPYAMEGRLGDPAHPPPRGFRMVPGTLLYCRDGERGVGLAVRLPRGGVVSLAQGGEATTLLATGGGRRIEVDWIVFTHLAELAK